MQIKVYAKLNLTLNVLGKRNGFHDIDSIATSVDVFDVVSVLPRADNSVTVAGLPQIPAEQNVAYKAACAFMRQFNTTGADIAITKGIPVGAGLGGSSADAAAVIYALCRTYNVDVNSREIHSLCAALGSDVNYMLFGGLARLQGKGDDVEYGKLANQLFFALTVFDTSMSTAAVYSQLDKLEAEQILADNGALFEALQSGNLSGVVPRFNNHLQAAAASLSDYAYSYLQLCDRLSLPFNMTGSGSAYYVTFDNELDAKLTVDLLDSRGFKTILCRSVPRGTEII